MTAAKHSGLITARSHQLQVLFSDTPPVLSPRTRPPACHISKVFRQKKKPKPSRGAHKAITWPRAAGNHPPAGQSSAPRCPTRGLAAHTQLHTTAKRRGLARERLFGKKRGRKNKIIIKKYQRWEAETERRARVPRTHRWRRGTGRWASLCRAGTPPKKKHLPSPNLLSPNLPAQRATFPCRASPPTPRGPHPFSAIPRAPTAALPAPLTSSGAGGGHGCSGRGAGREPRCCPGPEAPAAAAPGCLRRSAGPGLGGAGRERTSAGRRHGR